MIGAIGVMNTTLLSFLERTREFGVLRSIGWSRKRLLALVLGEAFVLSLAGAALGVTLGFGAVAGLSRLPDLRGIFEPTYSTGVFGRALVFAKRDGVVRCTVSRGAGRATGPIGGAAP